jgi:hypothetical protein
MAKSHSIKTSHCPVGKHLRPKSKIRVSSFKRSNGTVVKGFSRKRSGTSPCVSNSARKTRSKHYSRKVCPYGSVSRRAFSRKGSSYVHGFVRKNGSRVKGFIRKNGSVEAGCIQSKGLRSKGIKPSIYLPTLQKGTLSSLGYAVHESSEKRHEALRKALKVHGYSVVIKKLNAVRILSRNTNPANSAVYTSDIKYMQSIH